MKPVGTFSCTKYSPAKTREAELPGRRSRVARDLDVASGKHTVQVRVDVEVNDNAARREIVSSADRPLPVLSRNTAPEIVTVPVSVSVAELLLGSCRSRRLAL